MTDLLYEDPECIHGLEPTTCSICLGSEERTGPAEPEITFTARYDGYCPGCEQPISVGERIVRWSDMQYRHVGCTPEDAA